MRASLPRRLTRQNEFDRQALAAYKVAMRRYAGRSWVTGVGIGIKERKGRLHASLGPVIVIHVARKLRRVCFNGKTAGRMEPLFIARGFETIVLPSSSPANTMRLEEKLKQWRQIVVPRQATTQALRGAGARVAF